MEERSQRTPSWVWIVLIVAILVSLGCGLLFGGFGGYLLGSKSSCRGMEEHEMMPQLIEPDRPSPRLPGRIDPMPRMPDFAAGGWVTEVFAGTAAEKAGIQIGDVILEVDGKSLSDQYGLPAAIRSYRPGDRVTLLVWRPGQMMRGDGSAEIKVTLGEHPDEKGVAYLGVTVAAGMPFGDTE